MDEITDLIKNILENKSIDYELNCYIRNRIIKIKYNNLNAGEDCNNFYCCFDIGKYDVRFLIKQEYEIEDTCEGFYTEEIYLVETLLNLGGKRMIDTVKKTIEIFERVVELNKL